MHRKQRADMDFGDFGPDLDLSALDVLGDALGIDPLAPEKRESATIIPETGNFEADAKEEFSAIKEGFKARALEERKRYELATDSEYWCCLCFPSREHKEEFLRNAGLGEKEGGDKYLNGIAAAVKLGVRIDTPVPKFSEPKIDKAWLDFDVI